jgi:hypothetical protein
MNNQIEAMKQALEALELFCEHGTMDKPFERRNALYDAIEQAEKQEHQFKYTPYGLRADESGKLSIGELPRKEWVGLTDKDKNDCLVEADPCEALATPEAQELMRSVEAKLKEKNNGN